MSEINKKETAMLNMEKENELRTEPDILQTNTLSNEVDNMKLTTEETIVSGSIKKAALPDIKETDRSAILCRVNDNVTIEVIKIISESSKMVKGYKIFVCINGEPQMSTEKGIMLSQEKVYNMTDKTMEVLRNFDVRLTVDMIKEATERLQEFSKICQKALNDISDMGIKTLYEQVIELAMEKANGKDKEQYDIVINEKTIDIPKKALQSILDEIGVNCSCTIFAKKLSEYDYRTGDELIITDSSGGRLQVNRAGNKRAYRLKMNDKVIKSYVEAASTQERRSA